nr:hypothetical protein [Paenibacillus wynnii]
MIVKILLTRKLPSNNYTPFDYITAHSLVEFHNMCQLRFSHRTVHHDPFFSFRPPVPGILFH